MKNKVLITGITGQCASYLAEYLLDKDYEVHGLDRRKSVKNYDNIKHLVDKIKIHEGDITDSFCINKLINEHKFHSLYSLAAQSHVHTSYEQPYTTLEINTMGVLNILEAVKNYSPKTKMYQASTSEMYGSSSPPQNENTIFAPVSPYAASKLCSHWLVNIYAKSYNLQVVCGIMFNQESIRRGKGFVTRKITEWVKDYKRYCLFEQGLLEHDYDDRLYYVKKSPTFAPLELGNLEAKRDWSHAKDAVDAIYRICNQDEYKKDYREGDVFKSYVFGSGVAYSVRDFLEKTLAYGFAGQPDRFVHKGSGLNEVYIDTYNNDRVIVRINENFYRPAEVDFLQCDPSLIKKELGWKPQYTLDMLIQDMLLGDENE